MSTDRDAPERMIDDSPEYAAGYAAAMREVWSRLPPWHSFREGLPEGELRALIAFVESCMPNAELTGSKQPGKGVA